MIYIDDLTYKSKLVFMRVDFNVPIEKNGTIRDDTRIKAALPSINYLLSQKAKLILASHLGRPKGKPVPELSLEPVAKRLSELIPQNVSFSPDITGDKALSLKKNLEESQVLVLENLRFDPGEKANDDLFARQLADKVNYYINDAFGTCHRAHASVVSIPKYVKKAAAGFLLKKEIDYLNKAIHSPEKPYVAILGGAKVSDKIPVIKNLLNKADDILIGGAMAYTFLYSMNQNIGKSRFEEESIDLAQTILKKSKEETKNIHLPLDHIAASEIDSPSDIKQIDSFPSHSPLIGVDIGPKTIEQYSSIIEQSKTIFWNGPMGVFEIDEFAKGTFDIANAVASSRAISIIGGGDSVAAIRKVGLSDKISHISTGGGASLEYIANETLPGIQALSEDKNDSNQ